jgi:hypothetical protein
MLFDAPDVSYLVVVVGVVVVGSGSGRNPGERSVRTKTRKNAARNSAVANRTMIRCSRRRLASRLARRSPSVVVSFLYCWMQTQRVR